MKTLLEQLNDALIGKIVYYKEGGQEMMGVVKKVQTNGNVIVNRREASEYFHKNPSIEEQKRIEALPSQSITELENCRLGKYNPIILNEEK
jgi:hypothetical protein